MSEDQKALFRYRTIAPLLDPDLCWGEKTKLTRAIAGKIHVLPSGKEKQFSIETIRAWYKRYRKSSFEGLKTNSRNDCGKSRVVPDNVIQKACELKREVPKRTLVTIIDILERRKIVPVNTLKKTTLHRIFQWHQLTGSHTKSKAYWQRYQAAFPNDLWQSDQMHGPEIVDPNNPNKTIHAQLLAWLDDHSRVICHAQFYPQAKLPNLEHCLRKAIQKMGVPKMIYTDNGQIYSAKHLGTVCAQLGVRLVHATPYQPQGKGKQERFFGYVRSSFMPEVGPSRIRTLEQLNTAFWAWLELKYQKKVHSEIKSTPLDVFLAHQDRIRRVSLEQIRDAFLYREKRKIHKDCTFQLGGNYYEVMPALVKQEVEIQFDPDNMDEVKVFLAGSFFQQAKLLRVPPRRRKKDPGAEAKTKIQTGVDYLADLVAEHKQQQQDDLFGPRVVSNVSTRSTTTGSHTGLISILEELEFPIFPDFERQRIQEYDQRYGPFDKAQVMSVMRIILKLKGYEHHIDFYLDKLVEIQQQGGHKQ